MNTISVPTNSHSIVRGHKKCSTMENPRLLFIISIQANTPKTCPECEHELIVDNEQIYCPKCGLVTQDSYNYTAGTQYKLPHGLKLM